MPEAIRSLPVTEWPVADRDAWSRACEPSIRLRRGGAASGMRPVTQRWHARQYGHFMGFLARAGRLDMEAPAGAMVTPEAINDLLGDLARVGSVTRANCIAMVRRMAEILAPARDFGWLREIESDLKADMRPRAKFGRVVPTDRLLRLGLDLIRRGEAGVGQTNLRRARLVRDGLMIALLAVCPIRLKNLASLRLGRQIRLIDGAWWIILAGGETKTRRPDERPIPPILAPHIASWVERWRGFFLSPDDFFWASTKGGGLAYTFVGEIVTRTTRRELGVAVSPHLFRDAAVYTVATIAGDQMGVASSLLQHTDRRVTEKHYNKGASHQAVKAFQGILDKLKD